MTNDTNTLNGALVELGETLASNLQDMGVDDANAEDGLTTLANKILNVEPSVNGLNLNISLTLSTPESDYFVGESIILTAELSASYDDETLTNIDLSGVLTGATINFKIGNTVIGTGITDTNGIATYIHTFDTNGEFVVYATFDGSNNFDSCSSSNLAINVLSGFELELIASQNVVQVGDITTLTATLVYDENPMAGRAIAFKNGSTVLDTVITDSNGQARYEYSGTNAGWVNISVMNQNIEFYDGEVCTAEFIGNSITLGERATNQWLNTIGDVIIDWGDGTTSTVNNPRNSLTHNYTDGQQSHNIVFIGTVTSLGDDCFWGCANLTSIIIPNSVTSLGYACFNECSGLTSITIPNSVSSLGTGCFWRCDNLIDYQLYWQTPPKTWSYSDMPHTTNTIFTIPYDTSSNYIANNYPSNNLRERGLSLELASDKPIIQSSETSTITATLTHDGEPSTNKTLSYQIKYYNTVIDSGTDTTDNNGEITISYTGTGIGDVDVIVSYGSLLQETYEIEDCIDYQPMIDNSDESKWTLPSQWISNYSSNGWKYYASSYSHMYYNTLLTAPTSIEFVLVDYDNHYSEAPYFRISNSSDSSNLQRLLGQKTDNSFVFCGETVSQSLVKGATYRIEVYSDSAKLYENDTLIKTVSRTNPNPFYFYDSSGQSRYVQIKDFKVKALPSYDLSVTSLEDIVSSGDTMTITANLKYNGVVVSGETLNYQIKHGSTIIDSGSDTTDTNGEIDIVYTGTGIGDVDVIVSYGSIISGIDIEDCDWYDDTTTDKTNTYLITQIQSSNLPTMTWTNDGYYISGGTNTNILLIPLLFDNVEFEAEIKTVTYYSGLGFYFGNKTVDIMTVGTNATNIQSWRYNNGSWVESYKATKSTNISKEWVKLNLKREGTTVNITIKDIDTENVLSTWSRPLQSSNQVQCCLGSGGRDFYIKNIKIKSL